MPAIELRYGRESFTFQYDDARFCILGNNSLPSPLSDAQIGDRFDSPINSPRLDDLVGPADSVLLVVPDATRQIACGQIVNLVIRRLIANGTPPHLIRIIFATGIHRKVTDSEKASILTPFIAQRITTLDHDPRDLTRLARLGETDSGLPIELNRALIEHDRVILVGGVTFHYFAGFTGGRKLVCPGLASSKTVGATHKLAFDCGTRSRRSGVGTGLLDGNAVHEAFLTAAEKVNPSYCITTIVDDMGLATDVFCGDWRSSHRAACDAYSAEHTLDIRERRELVVVSCGGYPHDLNMIQAHKALEAAAGACKDGGTILLLAECRDGLGRSDFSGWFDASGADELADRLCERYQVNGQTAWSLLKKAERYRLLIATEMDAADTARMRMKKVNRGEVERIIAEKGPRGYILPSGAKYSIKVC